MNTKNNKRRRESVEKIEKTFIEFLQTQEIEEITVSQICKSAQINRSTFYANFVDIYDLTDKIREKLEADFAHLYDGKMPMNSEQSGALKMFRHIYENQLFYKTYFKLGYDRKHTVLTYDREQASKHFDSKHIDYHIEFFRSGLNAIIKMWLANGCKETPEELEEIICTEYKGRTF